MQTEDKASLFLENSSNCDTLRENVLEANNIIDCLGDLLFVIDKNRLITKVNQITCEFFKKKPGELIGRHCYEIMHGSKAPWCNCPATKTLETKQIATEEVNEPNLGIPLLITTSAILNQQGEVAHIIHIAKDISKQKKDEEAIKIQANLLDYVGQAIIMVDSNRIVRFWNNAAVNLYGWSKEQALGHKVTELLSLVSPNEVDETAKRLMAGESWSTETLAENKDGSTVPVILNLTPVYNPDGEFLGATSITTDISLQKTIEADLTLSLTSLSETLDKIQELNEKLRVVGSLTRHDVRNKLSTVTGYAYILKKKHHEEEDIVDGLKKMEQAVEEIVRILDFAKMYEQIGVEELTYINVEEKLNEAVAFFSGINLTITNECQGLTLLADSFLRQLFYNFIDNTKKYGKKTTIIKTYFEMADQDSLKLVYEDDGVGISFENKRHLFSEGFTTGGSTGFGLFLIKKMIDVYGWRIQEEGTPGEGARFVITIPKLNGAKRENYQIA